MKNSFFLFCLSISILSVSAQTTETEMPASTIQRGIEHVWRSSEQPKQTATNRFGRRFSKFSAFKAAEDNLPSGSERICAVCMDSELSPTTGAGTCSGHGGVRFWVYKTPTGDSVFLATWRHDEHPDDFTDEERSKLSAYQRYQIMLERKRGELAQLEENNPNKNLPEVAINSFAGNSIGSNGKDTVFVLMQQPVNTDTNYTLNWLYISLAFAASTGGALFIRKILNENKSATPTEIKENKTPLLNKPDDDDDLPY